MSTTEQFILNQWPSRRAVLEDARAANESLQFVAVHRWFQRRSIAKEYIPALAAGAKKRGISVSTQELASGVLSSCDQAGHLGANNQPHSTATTPKAAPQPRTSSGNLTKAGGGVA